MENHRSGIELAAGYKGRLLIEWRWSGGMAHSAGPSLSPAEQAVVYWDRARDYAAKINEGRTSLFEQLDVSLREIHSGQDGAYGHADLTMSFRLPPDISPEMIAAALQPEDGATVRNLWGGTSVCRRTRYNSQSGHAWRDPVTKWAAEVFIQNRNSRYERRRPTLELPDYRLWSRQLDTRPYAG